jgi:hypothetical protein
MIGYLQDQEDQVLISNLDKNAYQNEDLVSIKTVLNLPYYAVSTDFERAYGSVNVNGVEYEYVKRRVYNDTLELLCLPNKAKMQLQSVKNEILKITLDGQPAQSNKKPVNLKSGLPDFFQDFASINTQFAVDSKLEYFNSNTSFHPSGFISRLYRPPACNANLL